MISIPDMAILGAIALMLFGPEQLPKIARKAGHVMRDVQNTSESFIREMERAADDYAAETPIPRHDFADPAASHAHDGTYARAESTDPPYEPPTEPALETADVPVPADPAVPDPAVPADPGEPVRADVPPEAYAVAVPEPEPHGDLAAYGHLVYRTVAAEPAPDPHAPGAGAK